MTEFLKAGPDASIGDILFSQPERFGPLLLFANDVMRSKSELEPSMRELLAAYVSGLNDCVFCVGVHEQTAQKFGVEPSLLKGLLNDVAQADIADSLKPIFVFARKLSQESSRIVDADRLAVLEAGHGEDTLTDVIAIVSLFSFFNRLVDGHGVKGSEGIFDRDSQMLFAFGYTPSAQ
ncbi:MAG: carboxymuconolactone decarboxylase family protein [Alphaproteobacteria bacterium]